MGERAVLAGWVVFYLAISLYYFFTGINTLHLAIGLGAVFLFLYILLRDIRVPVSVVWCVAISIFFNTIGSFPLNGMILYELPDYDLFAHLMGFLFFTTGMNILYKPRQRNILIAILALIGVGAAIELSEYGGFRILGYGSGWLRFGAGDNSTNFGPWQDSMEDMLANLVGILLGMGIYRARVIR
ncbi:MAG: hypothetical protein ACQESG_01615 [Nanobdellota archaeon]